MRLLIWHKLFIAMLAATTIVVVVTLFMTRWSFNHSGSNSPPLAA
jgi:uncharacterized SAM-binding protein YcdF (DUF218 family)